MIRLDNIEQGSSDWFAARLGIPTASLFKQIVTPEGKKSGSHSNYANRLVQEFITQQTDNDFKSEYMERGNQLEPQARAVYAFDHDTPVETTGICYKDDDRLLSCSPDGLVPQKSKGLEIKCPKLSTYIDWITANKLPLEHKPQVQGSLYVTGYESWDFMAYHPGFKPFYITVTPDPKYQQILDILLNQFITKMLEKRQLIKSLQIKQH